ncbi:zinc metalloproteinase nas-4 [Drosophila novamexicana]|uniref:zinc metalloproteinase nas-4 n=1 Tax=Drosophila novamexicana TaxID=47314 RepID=UPI0011E5DA99|nr:zinc metalloproteinase nas-4 [Drosophila novamexicana]
MNFHKFSLLVCLLYALDTSQALSTVQHEALSEDDMRLTPDQLDHLEGNAKSRNVMLWSGYYWPKKELVYRIEGLSASDVRLIERAMSGISSQTCVRFRRTYNQNEPQVVIQRKDSGCWSNVGYLGKRQELNLGKGCMTTGIIQHELLHALALLHMQSDPNRNKFVKIAFENIESGRENNFAIYNSKDVGDFGLGYDYYSLMHYGPYAFSKNGKRTIIPLQSGVNIGQRNGLSPKDILKLKRIYC